MIELKKIDFIVDPLSVSTIAEVLEKAIGQINELQNTETNKKGDSFKDYYFGYVFDSRNESKHYIVSDATRDTYSFKANIVAADDLQQSTTVSTTGAIKNIPDYGFEYISELPTKIIPHTSTDNTIQTITSIDADFMQAQLTYDLISYEDPSNHTANISGIPQEVISVEPYEAIINQETINTLSIDKNVNIWADLEIINQTISNLRIGENQSTTILYKDNGLYNISLFVIGDDNTNEIKLKSDLLLNNVYFSGVFDDKFQSIIYSEANTTDNYDIKLLTINADTGDILKDVIIGANVTAPQTEIKVNWTKYHTLDCLLTFANIFNKEYAVLNIATGNIVFTDSKYPKVMGDLIRIGDFDYDLNTLLSIDIIPDIPKYSLSISGKYCWFLSDKNTVLPIDLTTNKQLNTFTLDDYSSRTIKNDKLITQLTVNTYTKSLKFYNVDGSVSLTFNAEWLSSYGSWPLKKDAVMIDGEKKYYDAKKLYVSIYYNTPTQYKIKYNLNYTFWIEYESANKDTYYKEHQSKYKTIFINSITGEIEDEKPKETFENQTFDFGDGEFTSYSYETTKHIFDNQITEYPSNIKNTWDDYLKTSEDMLVLQDPNTKNHIVIADKCTGTFNGYTSEGQTGFIVYDINGVYLNHGPIYGIKKDNLRSISIINDTVVGSATITNNNNVDTHMVFNYNPAFTTEGEKEKRIKYTYKPQPMKLSEFDYQINTGEDIKPVAVNVNIWN